MDIQSLRYYLAVYNTRSFSRAARDCYVTQPVISRKIAALEEEFHCALFRRTPQGVLPTEAGKRFREYAAEMLGLYEQTAKALTALSVRDDRRLSIAAVTPAAVSFLPRAIAGFYARYPGVDVTLDRCTPGELQALLPGDSYDFYITVIQDLEACRGMSVRQVLQDGLCLITRAEECPGDDRAAAALLRRRTIFVVPRPDSPHFYDAALELLRQLDVKHPALRGIHPLELHNYCVSAGMGVAISPMIHGPLEAGLARYPFQIGPRICLGIGWREERPLMSAFLRVLREILDPDKPL